MSNLAINTPLTIADIVIRQDEQGRYCLNDLHVSSGNESKHKPANFLRNQQAIDLIELLKSEKLEPVNVINGIGTLAVKEVVYAYAMWISPVFTLKVIRAYDALVTGKTPYALKSLPLKKTKLAVEGGLSLATQDELKNMIHDLAATLPKDKQASAVIGMWSALGTHFEAKALKGDSKLAAYKFIPEAARLECVSLLARLPFNDMVTLSNTDMMALIDSRVHEQLKTLPAPAPLEGEMLQKPQHNKISFDLAPLSAGESRRWLITQLATEAVMFHPLLPGQQVVSMDEAVKLLQQHDYLVVKKSELLGKLEA